MVNLTNFTKANLTYVKPKEVKETPNAIFVITSEPTLVESDYKGQKSVKVHCEGEWNGQKRSIDLSKTNARTVSKVLGDESKAWIGHKLYFEVYRTKTSNGELVDAININKVE